jgi:NAD(P)-dependent dehydrogenase (short-subunit alcohol dehydrogenase family)
VSALTEVLHYQLAGTKIRASVLYPGPNVVATNIFSASRNRPSEHVRECAQAMPPITLEGLREMFGGRLEITQPEEVAEHLLAGIRNDAFYILPRSERTDAGVRARLESVLARRNPDPPSL